ncbi:MAG: TetR/AcrR family transcriptional regulator [Eubacteriales bacterium]|nr:TetR/AcrR family transcriptional regulator [Eubacteriales bacterium]MDD3882663.1 TetR/AcrR family transcriptional regulator [Eubacteriales bacterium]MDD4512765.1 TetR/AcrR family transcriptional regulator [Eubacteriales bacterium]
MADKGDKTRAEILTAAKALFIKKGYSAVSMSDLCLASKLSRGGLYRHFSSAGEVFGALLRLDRDSWEAELKKAMEAGVPAADMLRYFFHSCIMEIQENAGRLSLATYEYERNSKEKDSFINERFGSAVSMMKRLLEYGIARGELFAQDSALEAKRLVIYIEGLKTASAAIEFTRGELEAQLKYELMKLTKKSGDKNAN